MPLSLAFEAAHRYASTNGIEIPTELRIGDRRVELLARLDTGAAHCIFQRTYAEALGLGVESGRLQHFRTMTGLFVAYEHEVTVHTLGVEFSAMVFFAEDPTFSKSFVGRAGWLDRVRLGILDHDRMLYLGPY
jgi:hypothetical protein